MQIFLSVARNRSLAAAGRALGLNHSTVYRRIRSLEASLRVRLFDRTAGRYTLTPAGEEALPYAEQAETLMLAFQRSAEGRDEVPSGPVSLTAPESLLNVLAPHLATFRARFPQIDLNVIFSDRFFDLSRREADVALRPTAEPPEDVTGRRIASIAWTVYAPADVNLTEQPSLPWGVYTDDLDRLNATIWRKKHHADEPVLLSVNSVPAMLAVICAARCQGLLPCFVGDPDRTVQRIQDVIPEAASALWLLVHPDLRKTARVRALLDHLWDTLQNDIDRFEGQLPQP
ncbi:MAG: LysR family transcriptional regulator [Myxococcota bacterium]